MQRLQKYKLYAKLSKCHFNLPEVELLGHIVGRDGIRVDPRQVDIIKHWPTPKSQTELRSFLGLANYFRRFIHAFATVTKPLHALTGKTKWQSTLWTAACQNAFDLLKSKLISAPCNALQRLILQCLIFLSHMRWLQMLRLLLWVLSSFRMIDPLLSNLASPAESNYDTTEHEMLAVIHALTVWRCSLDGMQVTIFSDHEPLKYLRTKPSWSPRQVGWSQFMERFNYTWEYRRGRLNAADPLSRAPHSSPDGSAG